jgi:hypothetical protein
LTGRQQPFAWRGNRNELLASYILSCIAAVTHVRRPDDYGLDLLCALITQEQGAIQAGRAFGVQVKSLGQKSLKYGGLNRKGEWKKYEIEWLFRQDQPILIAIADPKETCLKLYSTFRIWYLLLQRGTLPGQVELVPDEELAQSPMTISDGQWRYDETLINPRMNREKPGDGISYKVPLGKPILSFSGSDDDSRLNELRRVLDIWLEVDYRNVALIRGGVPYVWEYLKWETNQPPSLLQTYQAWNPTPGMNIAGLLHYISPGIASLLHNLVAQDSLDKATRLIPIAEWLEQVGELDNEGKKRIEQIRARAANSGPSKPFDQI